MTALAWLTDPIDPAAPCGPDLELTGDEPFLDYFYDAEGRLPERYVTTGVELGENGRPVDRLFDAKSVDVKAERATLTALLQRSRDLRLLSLWARWEALAWNAEGLADAVEGMAALVGAFGDGVHPALPDRSRDRRAAIEALTTPAHLLQPLHHLPLTGMRDITWRRWLVTQGKVEARPGEEDAEAGAILAALSEPGNAAQVDRSQLALSRMVVAARALGAEPLAPLITLLEGMLGLLAEARPDLAPPEPEPEATAADDPTEPTAPLAEAAPIPVAGEPQSRSEARAVLAAVEGYLARQEPSSAALLLVIQARHLIGKPLIEAMEMLLPAEAPRAVVEFGGTGFALPMERLKSLAAEIPAAPDADAPAAAPPPPIKSRADASGHLRAIAAYFRRSEPTSPIPILLDRARGWLERDFEGILAEILPKPPTEG